MSRDQWSTRLGFAGGVLGVAVGFVELTVGPSIPDWIGNKHDTTRLGLATVALSGLALVCAVGIARADLSSPRRVVLGIGTLIPGLLCFTTVGRLWCVPGALLVASSAVALAGARGSGGAVRTATARNATAILTIALGVTYVALGATASGLTGALGVAGGLAVIGIVATRPRLGRGAATVALVAAAAPFAVVTCWSVVTPLVALLIVAIGGRAVRGVTATGTATPTGLGTEGESHDEPDHRRVATPH
jgi:hypothetical protein